MFWQIVCEVIGIIFLLSLIVGMLVSITAIVIGWFPKKKKEEGIIDRLVASLRDDEGYYISWQANIAMSFIDEINRSKFKNKNVRVNNEILHEIANTAAKNFLTLLMTMPEKNTKEMYSIPELDATMKVLDK